jgi:hypothetical protein
MPRRSRDLYITNDPYYLLIRSELKRIQSQYRTPPRVLKMLLEGAQNEIYNCDTEYALQRDITKRNDCKKYVANKYNERALEGGRRRRRK